MTDESPYHEGMRSLQDVRDTRRIADRLAEVTLRRAFTDEDRAFIEMTDRRMELYLFGTIANCIRHTHPGLAPLEQPQFPDFGHSQGQKMREVARWLDGELATQPFVADERFTIADITAFCAIEFARGLMKFRPGAEGLSHLQAWRDRIAERPSAKA